MRRAGGPAFSDDLAVLADPGHCVRTFGTRDDFLIASACLNSTVSGLVSRTVLNPGPDRAGRLSRREVLRRVSPIGDVSAVFLDAVTGRFDEVAPTVRAGRRSLAASDRGRDLRRLGGGGAIRERYGIDSVNFVKPGVGEATRVLLRRVPWKILVREPDHPDHEHLRLLAADRGVPSMWCPTWPTRASGLVRQRPRRHRGGLT